MSNPKVLMIKDADKVLEAEMFKAENDHMKKTVLICHPHPQYGGNMHNNVISSVFKTLCLNEISCIRFNFVGVGKSTGSNLREKGDISDVHTCLDYLVKNNYEHIIICGYSYGAAIGCSIVNDSEKITAFCAISFPWDFMGEKFKELTQTSKPKLFIQGTKDNIADFKNFESHYEFYMEPKSKLFIKGADHFYWGFESKVSSKVLEFVRIQFGITG